MYLEKVDYPSDLKKLSLNDLSHLCSEIRELIVKTVSRTGGHLSSSLGVVELTVAIHYVFDAPKDKIIWDVGHQCYAHKILTGRKNLFHTLRQDGGISGFPSRQESVFDTFNTGHASNSISVAVGLAEAKKKLNSDEKIIVVIGDGALSGGMAFEALNHAGHAKSDILVILNDNEMSISRNIGALSSYLNRIMTGEFVSKARERVKTILKNIPAFGNRVYKVARYMEEVAKGLVVPGIFFEELGFQYFGPTDGHNLHVLVETLRNLKRLKGPILLHVVTKKGKGYEHAEKDPEKFHGVTPFDLRTGEIKKEALPTYTDIFGSTILKLAEMDDKVIAITAAMSLGTGLSRFAKVFPDRFYDIGIAEEHAVTFAAGLSLMGFKPYVAIYSTFLQRAYDQILMDVCLQNIPLCFCIDRGGIVGPDGPTHNGVFDLSYLRHMPNMVVMAPKDENELKNMLFSAYYYGRPVAIRYPRGEVLGVQVDDDFSLVPFATWEILKDGKEIFILACGRMVSEAMGAADRLKEYGISCGVVNGRFVKPIDYETLKEVAKRAERLVTLEENSLIGGFGSGILEALTDMEIFIPVKRIGVPDQFLPHGSQKTLRQKLGLTEDKIAETIREWLRKD
ncbi:MAG: 1-deoxy-D-xylulose-5-phosphate synthase [Desulfobacterota bacterium]|nr:1-deoxy-D-xylulose-5-phosphate synthase [Thermodesulfobacteriota bacterium]MDW8001140.1 1-deoxy-D-xylulose-5-phosphate synthase [Deltaproteobacteria bacterium]